MIVNGVAYAEAELDLASPSGSVIGQSPGCTERIVKYIANRPAKNISSLESHTMVPTLTMFGRVSECTLLDSKLGAVGGRGHLRIMSCRGPERRGVGSCRAVYGRVDRASGPREPAAADTIAS